MAGRVHIESSNTAMNVPSGHLSALGELTSSVDAAINAPGGWGSAVAGIPRGPSQMIVRGSTAGSVVWMKMIFADTSVQYVCLLDLGRHFVDIPTGLTSIQFREELVATARPV